MVRTKSPVDPNEPGGDSTQAPFTSPHHGSQVNQTTRYDTDGIPPDTNDPAWITQWVSSPQQTTLSASASINGAVVPVVYGERKVYGYTALLALDPDDNDFICAAFVFARGEVNAISNLELNDEDFDDFPGIGVSGYHKNYGGAAQSVPSQLSGKVFNSAAAWVEKYPGLAWVAVRIQWRWDGQLRGIPGNINISATIQGRKCYDFRPASGTYGTWIYTSNPILIAYDIETSTTIPWKGRSAAHIPVSQWVEWADHCDEVVNSKARYAFNGVVDTRDAKAALAEVLGHCHAKPVYCGGKLYIVGDKLPVPITGDWTSSGTAVSEDTSSGEATTELAAGDYVLIGSAVREVVSVTDDDNFVIDSSLSAGPGAKVRVISNVHLDSSTWVTPPRGRDIDRTSIPDIVRVQYINSATWKPDTHDAHDPTVTPSTNAFKATEMQFTGCTNADQAERHGQLARRVQAYQPYFWQGRFRGRACELFPGDICRATFGDGTDEQLVRVVERTDNDDDVVDLRLQEFDFNAYGDWYAATDTQVSIDPGYAYPTPDAPTAATQAFGESGPWDDFTLIPDPDDITTAKSWADGGLTAWDSVTYVTGPPDYTKLVLPQTATWSSWYYDLSSDLTTDDYVLVTGLVNSGSTSKGTFYVTVAFQATSNSQCIVYVHHPGDTNTTWRRFWMFGKVPSSGSGRLEVRVHGLGSTAEKAELRIKNLRVMKWEEAPESLGLFERWSWTEHGSASSSVVAYQMISTIGGIQVVASVPVGVAILEHSYLFPGRSSGLLPAANSSGFFDYRMRAKGHQGTYVNFPTPTQSFVTRVAVGGSLAAAYDVDETGKATGDGLVWNGSEWVVKPVVKSGSSNPNAVDVYIGDYAGGDYTKIEGSADGDIHQVGAALLSNETRAETPEHRGKLWRTTLEKSISNGVAVNLFQWDSSTTHSVAFFIVYEVRVDYTQISIAKRYVETGVISCVMTNVGGTVTLAVGGSDPRNTVSVNTGTGTFAVTCGTGNGTNYGRVNLTCTMTAGPTWVAGEVRYMVLNTDTDNNALSLFG